MNDKWKFISEYPISEYRCGLKAGDRVCLIKDIIIKDFNENPTGNVYKKGEIWKVLSGAKEKDPVLWLLQENGERHTWDDDDSVFEQFELIKDK